MNRKPRFVAALLAVAVSVAAGCGPSTERQKQIVTDEIIARLNVNATERRRDSMYAEIARLSPVGYAKDPNDQPAIPFNVADSVLFRTLCGASQGGQNK